MYAIFPLLKRVTVNRKAVWSFSVFLVTAICWWWQ